MIRQTRTKTRRRRMRMTRMAHAMRTAVTMSTLPTAWAIAARGWRQPHTLFLSLSVMSL